MTDHTHQLTAREMAHLSALFEANHFTLLIDAVEDMIAARAAATPDKDTLRAAVEAVTECPHGPRHYYAADATCQRCEMPSWVESVVRAALSADPTPTEGADQ